MKFKIRLTGIKAGLMLIGLLPPLCMGQTAEDIVRPFWGVGHPSARATGLGGAFTGVADDQSALFYNPAGLGHMTEGEINIGLDHSSFDTEFSSDIIGNGIALTATRLANMGVAMPVRGSRLTWAAGYNLVHSFERNKEFASVFEDSSGVVIPDSTGSWEKIYEDGWVGHYSVGIGYQASPKLAVGIALELLAGSSNYAASEFFESENRESFLTYDTEYKSISASLGVLLAPIENWRIGLLIRTPQNILFKEPAAGSSDGLERQYSGRGSFNFRLGSSYMLGPLMIAADATWFDYSQIRAKFDFDNGVIPYDVVVNTDLRESYEGALGLAAGLEYLLPIANAKVRGGYRLTPRIRNDNGDSGSNTYAFGFSTLLVPQLKFDFAYSLTDWHLSGDENWLVSSLTANLLMRL